MLNAANAHRRTVVDYGPDPNNPGRGVLYDVFLRLHGWLVPASVGGDSDPERQFHGYGPALQDFRGGANVAATGVVYREGGNAEISSGISEGPYSNPARRIFADRLRRRTSA